MITLLLGFVLLGKKVDGKFVMEKGLHILSLTQLTVLRRTC
ncbi:hypothetical protein LOK49_LG09G00864 [Camellia lanceoleosa]|uniref:Uncharacterized protein n=1 Tax=Camellia lanceoleosa TaxID=1840588 RepID=A0ACC0GMQ8_9ERIC|nr:hypothetical protein LOK49_LG09G00864 [Camellia lanceoleosa]